MLPEISADALTTLFSRLPDVAGPRASVAVARAPEDALDSEALLGVCWDTLLGETAERAQPLYVNPSMVHLAGHVESLAGEEGAVCAVGAPGSGRRTLLEGLARAAGRRLSVVSALNPQALARAVGRTGDWVLVRDVDRLELSAVCELLDRVKSRLLATASRAPQGQFPHLIEVPPLSARREDVIPVANFCPGRVALAPAWR